MEVRMNPLQMRAARDAAVTEWLARGLAVLVLGGLAWVLS